VLVGVRADGTKELVAIADGERESTDAWAELLRDCRRRGMGAPVVMVGDGALGLWAALREVFPATREQRCWVHKVANVLGALPKSVQAGARRTLNEIAQAEDRAHAERVAMVFKLLEAAQSRWRAVNGPHLVALVRAEARFDKGRRSSEPTRPCRTRQRDRGTRGLRPDRLRCALRVGPGRGQGAGVGVRGAGGGRRAVVLHGSGGGAGPWRHRGSDQLER
jgi:hypothetical protein